MFAICSRKPFGAAVRTCGVLIAVCGGLIGGTANAAEDAKWFVVRHHTTGNCWTAMLIQVNGEYAHAFAQLAGGPYDTKKQALEREAALEKEGVCTK